MPPQLDAVLLDLGNVLVFHDNAQLVRRLAERAGTTPEPLSEALWGEFNVLINEGHLDAEGIRREVCKLLGGVDIPMAEFFELWSSHFTMHEAVFPRIEALAKQVKLVLISNTNALHWDWLTPRVEVLRHFHALIVSHEVHAAKPKPAIFEAALKAAGTTPTRAVFFDDIEAYADAATDLGIHGRVFTTAAAFDEQLRALGLLP